MAEKEKALVAELAHLNYLYGLGVGLGLSDNNEDFRRLRKDLNEQAAKQLDFGWTVGAANRL